MGAEPYARFSIPLRGKDFAEGVIWRLPEPVRGSSHLYKYRLVFVSDGVPILRYDNEAGKGDHRHVGRREFVYDFRGPDDLLLDFWSEVDDWQKQHAK